MRLFIGASDKEAEIQAEAWKSAASAFGAPSAAPGGAVGVNPWPDVQERHEEGQGDAAMWERIASDLGLDAKTAKRRDRIAIELAFYAEIGEPIDVAALVARHSRPHERSTRAATAARRKYGELTRKAVEAGEAEIRQGGRVGRISSARVARKVMRINADGKREAVSDRHVRRLRAMKRKSDAPNRNST